MYKKILFTIQENEENAVHNRTSSIKLSEKENLNNGATSKKRKLEDDCSVPKILAHIDNSDRITEENSNSSFNNSHNDLLTEQSVAQPTSTHHHRNVFEAASFFEKHKTNPKEINESIDSNANRNFKHIDLSLLDGQKRSLKLFDFNSEPQVFIFLLIV